MVEPSLDTTAPPGTSGVDGYAPAATKPDQPTPNAEPAGRVIDLLDAGWLPPAGWLEQFASTDQPDQPSVDEDRAVIRATSRRIRAEGDGLHRRSERARERARDLQAASERLVLSAVDQHQYRDGDTNGNTGSDEWVAKTRAEIEARTDIHRAVGMIMLQHRCDKHDAWSILSGTSQRTNRKVRDLAAALIAHISAGHGYPDDLAFLAQAGLGDSSQ